MSDRLLTRVSILTFAVVSIVAQSTSVLGQGIYVSGVGPVNRSMGGAGTASPLDAIGALNWNPGSISALPTNELGFGMELLQANINLTSSIGPGTQSDSGWAPIPSIGWVQHMEGTPLTIGLGLYGIGGFTNNQAPGNALFGGAPAFAKANFMQVAPTISYQIDESLSVGFAPTITIGEVGFDPLGPSAITPVPAPGQGNRTHWGLGFQTGVYYQTDADVQVGFTFKSPQWMEPFQFFTPPSPAIPGGVATFNLDLPMILSLGFGYTGLPGWKFAADFRYFAYGETDGFRELGWESVFGAAFGVQRQLTDSLSLRLGANFNEAPITARAAAANIMSPLIQSYNLSAGTTYSFTKNVDLNVAYVYLGDTGITGPLAPVPGSPTVTNNISAHSAIMGITVKY